MYATSSGEVRRRVTALSLQSLLCCNKGQSPVSSLSSPFPRLSDPDPAQPGSSAFLGQTGSTRAGRWRRYGCCRVLRPTLPTLPPPRPPLTPRPPLAHVLSANGV